MAADALRALRTSLASQLRTSQAHIDLFRVLKDFPPELRGRRVKGNPHTAWRLLDHLRRTAEDLVAYVEDPNYQAPPWPESYWPAEDEPDREGWSRSVEALSRATEAMASRVEESGVDLVARVPTAEREDHHLFRCALVLLDHNAHHAGQLISLRRELGAWPPD